MGDNVLDLSKSPGKHEGSQTRSHGNRRKWIPRLLISLCRLLVWKFVCSFYFIIIIIICPIFYVPFSRCSPGGSAYRNHSCTHSRHRVCLSVTSTIRREDRVFFFFLYVLCLSKISNLQDEEPELDIPL